MDLEKIRDALLYCVVINYIVLLVWVGIATLGRGWSSRMIEKMFHVTPEQVSVLHLYGISIYKLLIMVFSLIPWVALSIVFQKGN